MKRLSLLALLGALPLAASAQTFSENFDVDHSSAWRFNSSITGDGAADNTGGEANFAFDYSKVGIPSAPHSTGGTTIGLKMESNVVGTGVFSGMSVSPLGKTFTGDFSLKFDAWQNVLGAFPAGGSGSTQLTLAGIGGREDTAQFQGGSVDGVFFAASGDGGTNPDYRAYNAAGSPLANASGAYAAGTATGTGGSTDNTNAYYTSKFQGGVPAAQLGLFPGQTGTIAPGALGMAWHSWEIKKAGTTVTWSVDGYLIATAARDTMVGSDVYLGLADINAGSSTDPLSRSLSFGLIDNVTVTPQAVPEPSTMALLALGGLGLVRRRRS